MSAEKLVVVGGDVTMDWHLARARALPVEWRGWNADDFTRLSCQHGGAAMLATLLQALGDKAAGVGAWDVRAPRLEPDVQSCADPRFCHSHAVWERFPLQADKNEPTVWRVAEFLGLDRARQPELAVTPVADVPAERPFDLLVLDDAALGFRGGADESSDTAAPSEPARALVERRPPPTWILLKMARPVVQGPLWDYLWQHFADRLVVVLPIDDVRRSEVQISRELSWERTAEDLARELVYNPRINALQRCAHVVIAFGTSGAFHYAAARDGQPAARRLTFDPAAIESEWEQAHPGGMIGLTTCLAASLVRTLLDLPSSGAAPPAGSEPDPAPGAVRADTLKAIDTAIARGLAAGRRLYAQGYEGAADAQADGGVEFPTARVVEVLVASAAEEPPAFAVLAASDANNPPVFAVAAVPEPRPPRPSPTAASARSRWSIVRERHRDAFRPLARDIVRNGVGRALADVPVARFGDLLTIDRDEIESYRTIRALVRSYCSEAHPRQPLSLAVFGPPGAGKSFGIEQVAKAILPGRIHKLTFNLSQLHEPTALLGAFHQVRDVTLRGLTPLVFWDEFDTRLDEQALGWLRYFLAPMQDGTFQEDQITHPIGPAIFIFAGGTSPSMAVFDRGPADADFVRAKGPDFVSRLKGFVDILGPNRRAPAPGAPPSLDPYFVVRRALLLRSMLERDEPQLFALPGGRGELRIDPGVLRALLEVPHYRHGARSIEALVMMSALNRRTYFERSALPPPDQLNLHTDGERFLRLLQQIEPSPDQLDRLAKAYHDDWRAKREAAGWTYGDPRDDKALKSPLLVDYAVLPDVEKEKNRAAVRQIPVKLAAAGYVLVPELPGVDSVTFSPAEIELMAPVEHQLWWEDMETNGYQPGTPTADDPYCNPYMVEWQELRASIQWANRNAIAAIPAIVAQAGLMVVRAP